MGFLILFIIVLCILGGQSEQNSRLDKLEHKVCPDKEPREGEGWGVWIFISAVVLIGLIILGGEW